MKDPAQSSEEKLRQLAKAIEALERKNTPPATPVAPEPKPAVELGDKTKSAIRAMAWGFGLFWSFLMIMAVFQSPPRRIEDLGGVLFSAFVCWLLFHGYRLILISLVRRSSRNR